MWTGILDQDCSRIAFSIFVRADGSGVIVNIVTYRYYASDVNALFCNLRDSAMLVPRSAGSERKCHYLNGYFACTSHMMKLPQIKLNRAELKPWRCNMVFLHLMSRSQQKADCTEVQRVRLNHSIVGIVKHHSGQKGMPVTTLYCWTFFGAQAMRAHGSIGLRQPCWVISPPHVRLLVSNIQTEQSLACLVTILQCFTSHPECPW